MNTGTPSEQKFEDLMLAKYGKETFVYRIDDAKTAYGLNGRAVLTHPRPADFVVTTGGVMFYAEVKSISHKTSGNFKLRPGQRAAATRQVAAGGLYFVFLHRLDQDIWYKISAEYFLIGTHWSWNALRSFLFH